MPVTGLRGRQIKDDDVTRADLNVTTSGSAVITKIIAGTNITISSTGVDAGTGDVTINASGGTGSVTSVGLTAPNIFGVTGSPVTTSGTIAISLVNQLANRVWAGPTSGAEAAPTFRALVAADIPALTLENLPDAWVKRAVRVATTANITLSGTQTIDGIAVVAGDRVLVKNQTTQSQNGIYVVAAGAWSRSTDADAATEIAGASVAVDLGTTNGGTTWDTDFKSSDTLGTTAMTWFRIVDTGYGQALTRTDDTNVTLTLGGTPATALIQPVSLTLGWTGQLAVGRGGTGASTLTGVLIGNGTSAFTAVTGTASQLLRRNSGNTAYEFFSAGNLTRTDDTNVTLTLGGTPTGALINAVSLTLGWSGQLAVGRGGTGASTLTGVVIGNGTSAMTAVAGTANQLLRRNAGNTAYEFFTHTFASTGTGTTNTIAKYTASGTIGNSTITDTGTTITLLGTTTFVQAASLPATIGGTIVFVDDYASPIAGRMIFGDNTGWSFSFSTRNASVTTDRFTFKDSGQLQLNAYTTTTSFTGTAVGFLAYDSSGNIICSTGTGGGGGVGGSGTTNYIPKFTASTTLGNSLVFDNGSDIGINTATPTNTANYTSLQVNGTSGGILRFSYAGTNAGHIYGSSAEIGINAASVFNLYVASSQKFNVVASEVNAYETFYARKLGAQIQLAGGVATASGIFQAGNNIMYIADWNTGTNGIGLDVGNGILYTRSSQANGAYIAFQRSGTTIYGYAGNSAQLFGAGYNGTSELGFRSEGAINFGTTGGVAIARMESTGQLKLPLYTSATSFTGTAAGVLAFDSSGNIITIAVPSGSSQWTTSGVNIYYTAGGVSIGTTTTSDILHIGRASGNNTYIRFDQLTRTTWRIGQPASSDVFEIRNESAGAARFTIQTTGQMRFNAYTAFNSFSTTDAQGILGFDTNGDIISMYAPIYRHVFIGGAPQTANNAPANISFFNSSNTYVTKMDLTGKKRARLHGRVSTAGTATSVLLVRYATTFSTTAGSYSLMGSSEIQIGTNTTGHFDSGWINLVAGAKGDVFIGLFTLNGDGAADPVVNQVVFEAEE